MVKDVKNYTDEEFRRARENLADILSLEERTASEILHDGHLNDVSFLVGLFRKASNTLAHKWNAPLLAKLPVDAWDVGPAGERRITPRDFASMRYLSPLLTGKDKETAELWAGEREKLLKELHEPGGPYAAMTEWKAPKQFKSKGAQSLPFSGDIAFMETINWLDTLLGFQITLFAGRRHKALGLPLSVALPANEDKRCSRDALQFMKQNVDAWCKDASLAGEASDSLRARVAVNLSVNRALWETCAKDARGEESATVAAQFLSRLNGCGIWMVPDEVPTRGAEWTGLAELLSRWFGAKGWLREKDDFFARVMTPHDIDRAVQLTESVQKRYKANRGGNCGPEQAELAHGSPENLFIFAMATVSVFYVKGYWGGKSQLRPVQTLKEFPAKHNKNSSRYPAFSTLDSGDGLMLPIHAEELIEQVYGQMFFSNQGWDLRAESVRQHAETQTIKRAYHEQLFEFAVKGRTSKELLNLFTQVAAYIEQQKENGAIVAV
ncbi:hypothetical protein D0U02_15180 [Burkholderia pseudomallei]|uniref:Uncharacterized protein n=2 Tax=Pseudomonadota TaxID=1224 RepID=Q63WZ3_BURPS|nr:hypothetical protein [Burkholderia pseudomallei]AJX27849.1 hypothetical protein AQ15_711 [Burkholderia pseudomallei K96243]MDE3327284.1 hypothetical protein [Burkholderia pseudomallei]RFS56072.1 hypothetical protein D0U05_13785 [Burkholderia pseudomallei]RFS62039.1 hypothetical protein D0U02_15180 [Burkholderia pseudomallei]RFS70110.1 hypothetical protein D0U01_05950 [Burkholderia pseudomallei]